MEHPVVSNDIYYQLVLLERKSRRRTAEKRSVYIRDAMHTRVSIGILHVLIILCAGAHVRFIASSVITGLRGSRGAQLREEVSSVLLSAVT